MAASSDDCASREEDAHPVSASMKLAAAMTIARRMSRRMRFMKHDASPRYPTRYAFLSLFARQETAHQRPDFACSRDEKQMPVLDDMQRRAPDAARKDLRVDERNDGIVVAVHDERRLAQGAEPEQAAPSARREQLIHVSASARRANVTAMFRQQRGIAPISAAVNLRAHFPQIVRIAVTPRADELRQHR